MFFGLFTPKQFYITFVSLIVPAMAIFVFSFNMFLETSRESVFAAVSSSYPEAIELLGHYPNRAGITVSR